MNRLATILDRQTSRVESIISALDAGDKDGANELAKRLHSVSPWELAAAGDAFVRDMLDAEDFADGVIDDSDDTT